MAKVQQSKSKKASAAEQIIYRCWGLQKFPGYDFESLPFVVARDNLGL